MLLREVVAHAVEKLGSVGIENAQVDVELLVGHVLGLSRGQVQSALIADAEIEEVKLKQLNDLFGRRYAREPLQHLTGVAYFRQLELKVGRGVFIPRPETEFVAQLAINALKCAKQSEPIAVDLGTGSGAIALAMATEVSTARVFAVEKSLDALPFTKQNFAKYGANATLIQGDLADAFAELNGQY